MDIIENVLTPRRRKTKLNKADKKELSGVAITVLKQDMEELRIRAATLGLTKTASAIGHAENVCDDESPPRVPSSEGE